MVCLISCTRDHEPLEPGANDDSDVSPLIDGEILDFSIREGRIYNHFFRRGPVSAHTVLTSGNQPRLVVAFPAGNSGVSLWFEPGAADTYWQTVDTIQAVSERNADGEPLFGILSEITVETTELIVDQAVLSNIRVIRDYLHTGDVTDAIRSEVSVDGRIASWYRDRIDGRGGYALTVEVLDGELVATAGAPVTFRAPADRVLRLRVRALTGDRPLTPIRTSELVTAEAADDPVARKILAFLSYEEKLLAGSWRFLTYFGRDTLLSIRLLMPVLTAATIEAGIGSVLVRLNEHGEVAHEEDIGEFALLRRGADGPEASDDPLYDYHMVDDDYLLAPIAARYLLEHPDGRSRAAAFLKQRTARGMTYGEALVSNLRFVYDSARPFAEDPGPSTLIKLKQGSPAGQWRDSREGLGNGRIAYDVNAVFVPAALSAIARLRASGLLAGYLAPGDSFADAAAMAGTWREEAPPLFAVNISYAQARRDVAGYAAQLAIFDQEAMASLPDGQGYITFNAVSLDAQGHAIPVLHSDDGFALLFTEPLPAELDRLATNLFRPFPAGLVTPVGLVVANPVFAPEAQRRLFTSNHYHGTVVWSWQQALLAAGLERQLRRNDLPATTRQLLIDARRKLWQVISSTDAVRNSELWSWSYAKGQYSLEPFGQRSDDETESNAAQLWSTVYLAIAEP